MSQEFDMDRDYWDFFDDSSRRIVHFYDEEKTQTPTNEDKELHPSPDFNPLPHNIQTNDSQKSAEEKTNSHTTLPVSSNPDLSTPENIFRYMANSSK